MKALVYTGPQTQIWQEMPEPETLKGECLVKVAYCGICGSDMHAYAGHDERRPPPLILGHEISGTVMSGSLSGKRVTVNPLVTCMDCSHCGQERENLCLKREIISMPPRQGGFAQYLSVPERNLVELPDNLSDQQAALCEPVACGWHAVRLAKKTLGQDFGSIRALVIGGGAIGVGAALSLKANHAGDVRLIEPNPQRANFLSDRCGLDVITSEEAKSYGFFDLIVDAVGISATRADATALTRPGGVIVHIGLGSAEGGLDVRRMTLQEITFIGTYTYSAQDFRDTASAMTDGKLGALDWTEVRPLSEGARAFEDLRTGKVALPKILLNPET